MKRGLSLFAAAASLAAGIAAADAGPAEVRICARLDQAAPPGGGPVLLVFFSTECAVCYEDLFEARYLVDKGRWPVSVVGVASGLREDLRIFLEKHAWAGPVVLDRRKALFRRFDADTVPFKVLLVGRDIAYRDDPYRAPEDRREELERCLTRLFSR